ncbi:GH3 auxin-responsive promoter family protein [Mastigocoleus sp. MO_188.B34]|uniref:GH3 family domain-containing protein n=1 Tax=Mastigocoleus sp. MO_188.B34 TaxID=3036635 RepID=UPI00260EE508|nr:GH3 auxin-responsive promoter family protein [Mastigocoleus sp. MO_188.B34]MDJ0694669.1 GH3 auxin-responsive promoter family protein [Mastigocoleus sp. MO_188.B34]
MELEIPELLTEVITLWLRLWGSKVGEGIYWTPKIEIADRGLLEIGDRVRVTHFYQSTPCLEFLGRTQEISDLVGEKLKNFTLKNMTFGRIMLIPDRQF